MKTAILRRGSAGAGAHSAFVGILPLAGDLQKGPGMSDRDLLGATHNGEVVMGMELAGLRVGQQSSGCELVKLAGRRAGMCAGVATLGQDRYSMRTYLSVGRDRALLFVFFARTDLTTAKADEESLVASVETAVPL